MHVGKEKNKNYAHIMSGLFTQESHAACAVSKDYIKSYSKIYGRNSTKALTRYQESMNEVSTELSVQNPNLLNDRKVLLEASRKKLDEGGYVYKKGKSHSKQLSSDESRPCANKRTKVNKDFRLPRIAQLQEEIKDKTEQIEYKELRRDGAKSIHNYKECDKVTEQMSLLKADRQQLQLELATLTKKQKKAEWYLAKKSNPPKVMALPSQPFRVPSSYPEPRSPSSVFSAPSTPSSRHTSYSSPTPAHMSAPIHPCPSTEPDGAVSDDTVLSSIDESEAEEPYKSHHFPPLRRQLALTDRSQFDSTSINLSQDKSHDTTSTHQHSL